MKKITALILCLSIILSLCIIPVYADDNHWAYKETQELINKGVVSGYSDGSLKLDNNITRAEFIKIINKSLNYSKKADLQFADVSEDKWYFDDMLIAKGEGYISGDDEGNANPELNITRAEASVILARILKLDINKTDAEISDIDEIPLWAKGSIVALFDKNIIKGYEDGSFKYNNNLTRGEGFFLITKVLPLIENTPSEPENKEENKDENKEVVEVKEETANVSVNIRPSSGGGGGGGGGGSYNPPAVRVAATPVLKNNPDKGKYLVAWNACTGAIDYTIKISLDGEEDYIISNYKNTSIDLYNDLATMAQDRTNASETYAVSVMSNGKTGISDSAYSKIINLTAEFVSLNTPVLYVRDGIAGGIHRAIFNWDAVENASNYGIKVTKADGTELEEGSDYQVDNNLMELVIPDTSVCGDDAKVSIIAYSADKLLYKDSAINELLIPVSQVSETTVEQNGSEKKPWIITSAEQLEAIGVDGNEYGYKLSHHYVITNNITVTKPIGGIDSTFSGSIKGKLNGTEFKPTITFNVGSVDSPIEYSGKKFGLVSVLGKEALVSNINFDGIISIKNGTDLYVGSAVGSAKDGAIIEKCTNNTQIISTGYVGGIVGSTTYDCEVTDCANFAELLTTGSYIGGIIGMGIGKIANCYNDGNIKGYRYIGGIAGDVRYATITNCANKGDLYATDQIVGGIIGWSTSKGDSTISKCFNTGNIYCPESKPAGFIVPKMTIGDSKTFTIDEFYNTGKLYDAVYDKSGELISSSEKENMCFAYEIGKSNTPMNYVIKNGYSTVPTANYIVVANQAVCSYENVYFIGEWNGDASYNGTDKLGSSLDEATLIALPENSDSFSEDVWFVDSEADYKYPQLKSNPHIYEKEVIPAINFNAQTTEVDGAYNINYSWTLPEGIKGLQVKVVNNTRIENVTGTSEDGWIILDYEGENSNGFTLENIDENSYYEIFVKLILSDDESKIYQENYEHLIPIV